MRALRWDHETYEQKKFWKRPEETQAEYEARLYEEGLLPGRDEEPWCDR